MLHAHAAFAQVNKCTIDGKTTYQTTPCISGKTETLRIANDSGDSPLDALPIRFTPLRLADPQAAFERSRPLFIDKLREPSSAVFSDVRVIRVQHVGIERIYFCGFVNARNGFGGMTGPRQFFAPAEGPIGIEPANFMKRRQIGGSWYDLAPLHLHCITDGERVG